MNGATQFINFAAGYLTFVLRGRKVQSAADFGELLIFLLTILSPGAGAVIFALFDAIREKIVSIRKDFAKLGHSICASFDDVVLCVTLSSSYPVPTSLIGATLLAKSGQPRAILADLTGGPDLTLSFA